MKQPADKILNAAQRLLLRVKIEDAALLTETAKFIKSPSPKGMAPVIEWDGKDSLDAFMDSPKASKYLVQNKATKVLGLGSK